MTEQAHDGFLSTQLDSSDERNDGGSEGFLSDHIDGADEPSSSHVSHQPEIRFSSSENMEEQEDESVHLIVTSPPYNVDWGYGETDDDLHYGKEYLPMLARVFNECYRVLVPGGRMVVNVPSLVREGAEGGTPIGSDLAIMLQTEEKSPWYFHYQEWQTDIAKLKNDTDWKIREWITWDKGFNDDGLAPNGSFPRPWGILLNNMHEIAIVAQKPGDREVGEISDDRIEDSKINKESNDLCDDVWDISPDNGWTFDYIEGEDVPPFPEEFVKRCIKIWTYKDDTVLDPFAGRFTVGKVAKSMERNSVGYEIREELKQDIEDYTGINQTGLGSWS